MKTKNSKILVVSGLITLGLISWKIQPGKDNPETTGEPSNKVSETSEVRVFSSSELQRLNPARSRSETSGRVDNGLSAKALHEALPKTIFETESEVEKAIATVDLWNPQAVSELTQALRKTDAELVRTVFEEGLETDSRERLISVASETEGAHLSRFWQTVLEDKVPTVLTVEGREEPNLFRNHEIQLAIRGLRLIATDDAATRNYLEELILDNDKNQSEETIRKQAFEALKEVDGLRATRVLRLLKDEDPLNGTL